MRLGIHLPQIGRKAGPEGIKRAAVQAEKLGFADVWASEHIIIPAGAMYPPSPNFYDPVLTLTWAAAYTRRVGLGTSVLVLPMRHPLPLAKELATLQNLSGGRLILGAGVGWMEAEFEALGVPFKERGRRMDEGIAMMRAVWSDDPVSFPSRWIPAVIDQMRMMPKPEKPIPIWIGGTSEPALRRAARLDGWLRRDCIEQCSARLEELGVDVAALSADADADAGSGVHLPVRSRVQLAGIVASHGATGANDGCTLGSRVCSSAPPWHASQPMPTSTSASPSNPFLTTSIA